MSRSGLSLAALAFGLNACNSLHAKRDGPPNILLVSMDTCRYDHLGLAGYERDTSPNLDRLAARGTVFERTYVQSNETLYSHASIFTSLYAGSIAALGHDFYVPDSLRSLPEVLQLYGYTTAGFTGGAHMKSSFGFDQGFDIYLDDPDFGSFFHTVPSALYWLEDHGQERFFLFVHGYDCHSPYRKPLFFENVFAPRYYGIANEIVMDAVGTERLYQGRYYSNVQKNFEYDSQGRRFVGEDFFQLALKRAAAEGAPSEPVRQADLEHIVAHYDGGLAYADFFLGQLLAGLERLDLAEDTLVAVFSDHGEGLTDYWHFHHRPHLREKIIHVPLVLYAPGLPYTHEQRIDQLVEATDIVPTLLEVAGATPLQGVDGRSLLPLLRDEGEHEPRQVVFSESRSHASARMEGAQLILHKSRVQGGLEQLRSPEDRSEALEYLEFSEELAPDDGATATDRALFLRDQLLDWLELASPAALGANPEADEALQQALHERGYW